MYDRYKTLQEYMKTVHLWEEQAPAIGLILFFSAVSLIAVGVSLQLILTIHTGKGCHVLRTLQRSP